MKNTKSIYDKNTRLFKIDFKTDFHDTFDGEPIPKEVYEVGDFRDFRVKPIDVIEILSPANVNTYKQAVYNGANAIYFGYGEFNARANGDNFQSLKEVVDFCHFYNVKAYLAINICFFNNELAQVTEVLKEAEEANLDAFIICDLSLIPLIRKHTTIPIHISTQLGAHNRWGIDFLHSFCVNRAVLSREMTFKDIRATTDSENIETEVFVHGALCSCFSGGCLISSMLTGNSANRGKCNQLCRMCYQAVVDGVVRNKGYLLSAKDICLDEYVEPLADIGVASLKIEGRLKRPEYVGGVTSYYADIKKGKSPIYSREDLKILFNRGDFTPGYFEGNSVIYPGQPNHIGVSVGKIVNLISENKAYVKSEEPLQSENGYKVLRNGKEVGGAVATGEFKKGFSVIQCNSKLKVGDEIRLTNNKEISDYIKNAQKRKTIPIKIRMVANERPKIEMKINNQEVVLYGSEFVSFAQTQPFFKKELIEHFEKCHLREIRFQVTNIELYNAFMTKASLNLLRRSCIDFIWSYLLGFYDKSKKLFKELPIPQYDVRKIEGDICEVRNALQYKCVAKRFKTIVYNPLNYDYDECCDFYDLVKKSDNTILLKIPIYVPTDKEELFEDLIEFFDGVLANNIGAVYIANKLGRLVVCGPNLNITNTKNWLINNTSAYIASTELTYAQLKSFKDPLVYAYGHLPLMHLNFCPRKLSGMQCGDCDKDLKFRDEKGEYPIETQKFEGYCEHVLRNGVLTDIGTKYRVRKYFDFCLASCDEIKKIISSYYGENEYKPVNTNKLHLTRGAN